MPKPGARVPSIPEGSRRMVLCVPDNVEWLTLVTGCLAQLTFGWYYNKDSGDYEAAVTRAKQMYFEFQDQNGLCDMINCDDVADCIENNEDIQNIINNMIQNRTEGVPGYPLSQQQLSAPFSNPDAGCDLDALWGSCLNAILTMNRNNVDFLETIEAITNNQEALSEVVSFIPIIGDILPVPELIRIVEKIREWLAEAYEAGYDLDLELDFACALFCLSNEGCVINAEQMRDYFFARAQQIDGFENAFDSALTLITALANWEESIGETVATVMFAAQFGFFSFLSSAFGMEYEEFKLKSRAGIPDDDWETTCVTCEWDYAIDFPVDGEGTWINGDSDPAWGMTFVEGVGWQKAAVLSNYSARIWIPFTRTGPVLDHFEMDYQLEQAGGTNQFNIGDCDFDFSPYSAVGSTQALSVGTHTLVLDGLNHVIQNDGLLLELNSFFVTNGKLFTITAVRMSGAGIDPLP